MEKELTFYYASLKLLGNYTSENFGGGGKTENGLENIVEVGNKTGTSKVGAISKAQNAQKTF